MHARQFDASIHIESRFLECVLLVAGICGFPPGILRKILPSYPLHLHPCNGKVNDVGADLVAGC